MGIFSGSFGSPGVSTIGAIASPQIGLPSGDISSIRSNPVNPSNPFAAPTSPTTFNPAAAAINPPRTGPGGSPQTGSPWTPPASVPINQAANMMTGVTGMRGQSSQPTLDAFLQQDLSQYTSNPWAVEHGIAPKDISAILMGEGQNYLGLYPGTGDMSQLHDVVSKYAKQYSDWLAQYNAYLGANGQNLAGLAPEVSQAITQGQAQGAPPVGATPTSSTLSAPPRNNTLSNPANVGSVNLPSGAPSSPTDFGGLAGAADPNQLGAQQLGMSSADYAKLISQPGSLPITDLNQLVYSPNATSGPASTPNHSDPLSSSIHNNHGVAPAAYAVPGSTPSAPSTSTPAGVPAATGGPGVGSMLMSGTSGYTSPPLPGISPDQMLAYNSGDMNYLRQIIASGGLPVDATGAWQNMVAAQQTSINRNLQMMKEQFGGMGDRYSTSFGTALEDYVNQATLDQNSLLGQMTMQSQSDAMNRIAGASSQLGGFAQQSLSQLSSQDFQSAMQATGNNFQAAMAMLNAGYGAASQLNQTAAGASTGMSNAENSAGMQAAQQYLQMIQQGMSSAQALAAINQQNMNTGATMGGQEYAINQDQINRLVQQYMSSLPQANPLIPYFSQGANTYPQLFTPAYPQSQISSIMGALGSIAGMTPAILSQINKLINPSSGGSSSPFGGGSVFSGSSYNPFVFSL